MIYAKTSEVFAQKTGRLIITPRGSGRGTRPALTMDLIATANFIWREMETIDLEPWYHHPHDRMEHVSHRRLFAEAIEPVMS